MWQLRQIYPHRLTRNVLAQSNPQRTVDGVVGLALEDLAQGDDGRGAVGNLDPYHRPAGNRRLNADGGRGKRQCQIVLQLGDALDLDSWIGFDVVERDRRTAMIADCPGPDTEAGQLLLDDAGLGVEIHRGRAGLTGPGKKINGRQRCRISGGPQPWRQLQLELLDGLSRSIAVSGLHQWRPQQLPHVRLSRIDDRASAGVDARLSGYPSRPGHPHLSGESERQGNHLLDPASAGNGSETHGQ